MPSTNVFNEVCVEITLLRSIPYIYNAVYLRLCIDLMHITPPVKAEGYDGSNHPRCAECLRTSIACVHPAIISSLSLFVLWLVCSGLFFIHYCFSFKLSIGSLDKCHTSTFNALITKNVMFSNIFSHSF